jgi:hypothetical protein
MAFHGIGKYRLLCLRSVLEQFLNNLLKTLASVNNEEEIY